jgi:hypothetical protein
MQQNWEWFAIRRSPFHRRATPDTFTGTTFSKVRTGHKIHPVTFHAEHGWHQPKFIFSTVITLLLTTSTNRQNDVFSPNPFPHSTGVSSSDGKKSRKATVILRVPGFLKSHSFDKSLFVHSFDRFLLLAISGPVWTWR